MLTTSSQIFASNYISCEAYHRRDSQMPVFLRGRLLPCIRKTDIQQS